MVATNNETASKDFVIERTFDAPRQLVWDVCTQPEHMKQWYGPKGFTNKVAKMDFRPGGMFHYCLEAPNGMEIWGRALYRDIDPPQRLVYVNSFSDAEGGLTHHPMSPTWPLEMLTVFTFTEQDGKTTLKIQWSPINPTPEEREAFDTGHDSMRGGWTGSLDQLTEYLKELQA